MARVLVTGGFGTIGRWVLRELLKKGHSVTTLELDTAAGRKAARSLPDVRVVWGDLRDARSVREAVKEQEYVIHMAFILTPRTEEDPEGARAINVGGTTNVIAACEAEARPPRLLFCSSVEVFGKNRHLPGPRRITDPVSATSVYTAQKIACERLVTEARLDTAIVRFGAVIDIALSNTHPLMFEFPFDVRFEALHPADAATAVANAVSVDAVWGRRALLLLGGGASCQTTYGEFLNAMLTTLGVGPLPEAAFTRDDYPSDWLDTEESQRLLDYQRRSLADIRAEIEALLGFRKAILPLVRPLVRRSILAKSPYWGRRPEVRSNTM
ncbi:UDP-glucose 4-epimerase [Minicystis rosea]|nr:UDP-glucose 4-epimerase [Minicystis rosea]